MMLPEQNIDSDLLINHPEDDDDDDLLDTFGPKSAYITENESF